MKWLLDANGNIVTRNGQPVLVRDDGSEMEFDGPAALSKITALNKENQTFRTELKTVKETLEKFGDADPDMIEAFLTELEELGGKEGIEELKAKGTVDVDNLKKQISSAYEDKIAKLKGQYDSDLRAKDDHIYRLEVSSKFASSPFIADKLTIPPDMAEAVFAKHFKIEEGKVVTYLNDEKIWSKKNPGELADFDEAIEMVVGAYPRKDQILKGANAQGTGTRQQSVNGQRANNDTVNLSSTQKIAAGLKELAAGGGTLGG